MFRSLPLALLLAVGCGTECLQIECSPAVLVTAELPVPASAPLEGSLRLCHQNSCLDDDLSLDPSDPSGWEITFEGRFTAARFTTQGDAWVVEAEVHAARPEGYFAGDSVTVLVRDGAGDALLAHEGAVADKLENDACGPPCAIQRVDL